MGEWTSSLHKLIKEEYEKQQAHHRKTEQSTLLVIQESIKKKYQSARNLMTQVSVTSEKEGRFNFVEDFLKDQQITRSKSLEPQRLSRRPKSIARYISIQEPKTVEYKTEESAKMDVEAELTRGGTAEQGSLERPLDIYIDGPFGSPSSNIYRAEHAVLVGTGIGVTPFASILQSIAHR